MSDPKERFLSRTNPARTADRAFQAALEAATRRNPLYRDGLGPRERRRVREHWTDVLREMASRYEHPVPWDDHERDLEALREEMNRSCGQDFRADRHPRYGYDPGFRLSHAQKSLSVVLKHLWCLGEGAEPPSCPVDGRVLQRAGLRYPRTRWTYVNTLSEHRTKLEALRARAREAGQSLAVWELPAW